MPKLREQDRAVQARKAVDEAIERWRGNKALTQYRQELQQLPSRILVSGLGQTLAFYASKAKEGQAGQGAKDGNVHGVIGSELARFLTRDQAATTVAFLDKIMNEEDAAAYRIWTRETLAYAEWLKRYAAALIEKPEGSS